MAGGVGGAKLAVGLSKVLSPQELTVVVNTGDDEEFHGLHVSPDLDTVMYALAGLTNASTGWGVEGDTFETLAMLERYGGATWFNLGDKDMATHIRRTQLLKEGWGLSDVTRELCRRLDIQQDVVPMSDSKVRTMVETDEGDLPFQVYFVQRGCQPVARKVHFTASSDAVPAPGFISALEKSELLVLCPSNPFLSIGPVLSLPGVRHRIETFTGTRVAVSPIVGGKALRGPAGKLLAELGHDVSCVGVAKEYVGLCDIFVVDEIDRRHAAAISSLGMRAEVAQTVMETDADKVALAKHICGLAGS